MREIKFRAYSTVNGKMWPVRSILGPREYTPEGSVQLARENNLGDDGLVDTRLVHLMQYTGLKDKNGDNEIYECDIIDTDGNVIGNQYETPALLKEKTNLLVQGFGTKAWLTTYTQAVERGCHDA